MTFVRAAGAEGLSHRTSAWAYGQVMLAKTDRNGEHPPIEQYLAAIYTLEEDGAQVVQARLAERVGHSAPTVSEMVRRLKGSGYITAEGRLLRLTSSGRQIAESVVRKHRLAGRFMTDVLGLPWHLADVEADRWEHVISDDVEKRLVDVLGNPTTCPHGCPIPGSSGQAGPSIALADAKVGEQVCFCRVRELANFDVEALKYLEDQHFVPGSKATVTAEGPDGSLVLDVGGRTIALGAPIAKRLSVTPAA
ncbi:MAG: metal-dependent transcriptional regulator [Acidimicrobiales bacterium]